jgi:hypothetical protein
LQAKQVLVRIRSRTDESLALLSLSSSLLFIKKTFYFFLFSFRDDDFLSPASDSNRHSHGSSGRNQHAAATVEAADATVVVADSMSGNSYLDDYSSSLLNSTYYSDEDTNGTTGRVARWTKTKVDTLLTVSLFLTYFWQFYAIL